MSDQIPSGQIPSGSDPDPNPGATVQPTVAGPAVTEPAPAAHAPKPWYRRTWAWLGPAILLPVIIGTSISLLQKGGEAIGEGIVDTVRGPGRIEFQTENGPLVGIDVYRGNVCAGNGYVYPSDSGITTSTPPNEGPKVNGKAWNEDPEAFGAVPAGPAKLYIGATGPEDHSITLTGLTFNVTESKPPLDGPYLRAAEPCGGMGEYRYAAVDLGAEAPYYVDNPTPPSRVTTTPLSFPYTVTAFDVETLFVKVSTVECRCSWTADLHWTDGEHSGTTRIDNEGKPFEITPTEGLESQDYDIYTGEALGPVPEEDQ
jgi:hypothetical protein